MKPERVLSFFHGRHRWRASLWAGTWQITRYNYELGIPGWAEWLGARDNWLRYIAKQERKAHRPPSEPDSAA